MSTARGLKVIKNNVNKNTEYKSEFWVNVWRQPGMAARDNEPLFSRAILCRRRVPRIDNANFTKLKKMVEFTIIPNFKNAADELQNKISLSWKITDRIGIFDANVLMQLVIAENRIVMSSEPTINHQCCIFRVVQVIKSLQDPLGE